MLVRSWIYLYGCFGTAPNKNKKNGLGPQMFLFHREYVQEKYYVGFLRW